jgi:hypothetical protein
MTTPRVTEIPIAMAPVEPDSFIDNASRLSVAERRLAEREARERRTESEESCPGAEPAGRVSAASW